MKHLFLCIIALFIFPNVLFAYLDPGTGSLLLSSIVALFASAIFFLKSVFYRLARIMGGGGVSPLKSRKSDNHALVFYSEGKQYHNVFSPILDFLDSKHYPYTYLTSEQADLELHTQRAKSSPHAQFEYIGTSNSNKAITRLNSLRADMVVMTTPQLHVLQIKRSKGVKHYCHIIHALSHIDTYEIFALDYFDSVLLNSSLPVEFIRKVERVRGLKAKSLHITGCTYADVLQAKLEAYHKLPHSQKIHFFEGVESSSNSSEVDSKLDSIKIDCHDSANAESRNDKVSEPRGQAESTLPVIASDSVAIHTTESKQKDSINTESKTTDSKGMDCHETTASHNNIVSESTPSVITKETAASPCFASLSNRAKQSTELVPKTSKSKPSEKSHNNSKQDSLALRLENDKITESKPRTILLAPSWGRESLLSKYGMKLIAPFMDSEFYLIIRPHPQSFVSESSLIASLQEQTKHCKNIAWDSNKDNIYAMYSADLMIGDFSGVMFDFACLFEKPILAPELEFNIIGYDLEDICKHPWVKEALPKLGKVFSPNEIDNIKALATSLLSDTQMQANLRANISSLKDELWAYRSRGGEMSALALFEIEKGILESRLGDNIALHTQINTLQGLLDSNNCDLSRDLKTQKIDNIDSKLDSKGVNYHAGKPICNDDKTESTPSVITKETAASPCFASLSNKSKLSTEKANAMDSKLDSKKLDCHDSANAESRNNKKTESAPHTSLESKADYEPASAVGQRSTAIEMKSCVAPESRPLRGAEALKQGGSSAAATLELEAEKRGTPLDCRKSGGFFGAKGSGEGINPFLRKRNEERESKKEKSEDCEKQDLKSETLKIQETKATALEITHADSTSKAHSPHTDSKDTK